MPDQEFCVHACTANHCWICRDTFVNAAVIHLYEKRWLMGMNDEQHEAFRQECWRDAQALWKARVGP